MTKIFIFCCKFVQCLISADLMRSSICRLGMNRMYRWNSVKRSLSNVHLWLLNNKENVKTNVICSHARVIRRIIATTGNWTKRVTTCKFSCHQEFWTFKWLFCRTQIIYFPFVRPKDSYLKLKKKNFSWTLIFSPRYGHVILISRYLVFTGVNWS